MTGARRALVIYTAFIVYGTTIPFSFDPTADWAARLTKAVADLRDVLALHRDVSLPDLVSNFLLFMPFGALVPLVWRERPTVAAVAVAGLAGCLLSALVEAVQTFAPERTTSLLDVIVNTVGSLGGAALTLVARREGVADLVARAHDYAGEHPRQAAVWAYLAVLIFWQLAPYNVTIDVGAVWQQVKNVDLRPPRSLAGGADFVAKALLFAPLAVLWARSGGRGRHPRFLSAIALSFGTAAGIEVAQLFVEAHTTTLADGLAGLVGGVYGSVILGLCRALALGDGHRTGRRLASLAVPHIIVYAALVAWQPFEFGSLQSIGERLREVSWMPFAEYYQQINLYAVADQVEGVVLFALFALASHARAGTWHVPQPSVRTLVSQAALIAAVLEGTQLWIVGRSAGTTDVVNSGIGAWLGHWAWTRWVESREARRLATAASAPAPLPPADGQGRRFFVIEEP